MDKNAGFSIVGALRLTQWCRLVLSFHCHFYFNICVLFNDLGELASNCKELQTREGVRKDGEHHLRVKTRVLQIYCAEMQTSFPKEYVTLRSGHTDNYSEVYGYR